MRSLTLHMGLPKTGTTSIQDALWEVRDRLARTDGLLYPPPEPNHTNAVCTMFLDDPSKHITNRMAMRDGPVDLGALQASYRAQMEAGLERGDWSRVLISAEGLSNLSAKEIAKLRDWISGYVERIEVLYWVREPVAHATSDIQQRLKSGATLQQMQGSPPLPNFKGKISNAIRVFGREAVTVRPFEAAREADGGVVGAFADDIGLSAEGRALAVAAAAHKNESLSDEAARMLDHLNRTRPVFGGGGPRAGSELVHLLRVRGERFALPDAMRRSIHEATRGDVAWLNETFGLSLYEAPLSEMPAPERSMRQETVNSTATVLSDLVNAVDALTLTLGAREALERGDRGLAAQKMGRARELGGACARLVEREARRMGLG